MIPYEKWPIVYEDDELDVKRDPQETEGYGLSRKGTEDIIFLPRGTLKDIAQVDRNFGRAVLERFLKFSSNRNFFKGTSLTYDSLIAAIDKAYIKEEERKDNDLI